MAIDNTAVKSEAEEEAPKPVGGSAPSEDTGDTGSSVETPENGPEEPSRSGRGDSPIATITELRADRRHLREENAALKKHVQELTQRFSTQPPRTEGTEGGSTTKETPTFFEDPDKHLAEREKKLSAQIINDLIGLSEKQEALKIIRSQPGFSTSDEDAFADLMEEHGLDVLARTQPLKAAKLGAKLWAEEKGIKPVRPEAKARAASVRGGAPGGGVKKIPLSHIRELQTRLSKGENVDAELREAWAAAKEGRIIED